MFYELYLRGIKAIKQHPIQVSYKEKKLAVDFRCDLFVEDCIVVELKSVQNMDAIHHTQTMTYARLLKVPKSILINFNCKNIFDEGQKTFVNKYFRHLPDE